MQRWLMAAGGLLILLVSLWWVMGREPAAPSEAPSIGASAQPFASDAVNPTEEASVWAPPIIHYDTYESQYGQLPASLVDTQIPFFVTLDAQQHLVPTEALRRFFEYFFTTVGEEPLDTIIARIEELLNKYLPEPAASEALAALQQYVALKQAELALEEQLAQDFQASQRSLDLRERGRMLRDLRATQLPRELYEAFYGEEDKRDDYALERLDIMRDSSLSEAEKYQLLQKLEADLPPALQHHVREQRQEREVNQRIDEARARGASSGEIFQIRAQVYGFEAAQRFAEADQRKDQWESRIADYRRQRAAVLASPAFTESDKQAQIEQLRQQHFDAQEQLRIPTVDRIWDEREGVTSLAP